MCGIAEIIFFKGSPLVKRKELPYLKKMASALRFRAQDDEDSEVAFVFHRHSNIDIEGGRQPFETKRLLVKLQLIDGEKSLNTLLQSLNIQLESVLPDLEEGLEYRVLEIVN